MLAVSVPGIKKRPRDHARSRGRYYLHTLQERDSRYGQVPIVQPIGGDVALAEIVGQNNVAVAEGGVIEA